MLLRCLTCGKEFEAVGSQRYCSPECKALAISRRRYPKLPVRKCAWCGKEFVPYKGDQDYCSQNCMFKGRYWGSPEKAKRVCPICGRTFTATRHMPKYCSDECRIVASKKGKPAERICRACGKTFLPDSKHRKYCSKECRLAAKDQDKRDQDRQGHDRRRYSGNREVTINRDLRQCAMCGATEDLVQHDAGESGATSNLVVHHLDETGSSPNRNDNQGNLVTLCRACHVKVHAEQIHAWHKGVVVTVKCGYCGKEFRTPQRRIDNNRGKYCSRECAEKAKLDKWVTITCQHCGKEFTVQPCRARRGKVKYCSMACRKAAGYASRH